MSIQSAMLTAMLAALSAMSVNALPQGATTPPNAVAMLYTGGGCTGKSTTFAISGNNVCVELPAPATSAKIVSYAAAGCQGELVRTNGAGGEADRVPMQPISSPRPTAMAVRPVALMVQSVR